jgi:hypothetical protein
MLVFIVPLQSPRASSKWEVVSALCERTLRSICGQTCGDFRVFLVCNEAPKMNFTHEALTIIEDEFAIPERNTAARMYDKHEKLKRGLIAARSHAPCHIMYVDADDCVSRTLAAWCLKNSNHPGWYIPDGYVHTAGSRWLYRYPDFDQICGTAAIVRCETADFPQSMKDEKRNFFMVDCGHFEFRNPVRAGGRMLEPLPFPGAVYMTATGENDSGITMRNWRGPRMILRKMMNSRLLTRKLRAEFGIYEV